jgi:uncharacterized protein (TIGR03437 family)
MNRLRAWLALALLSSGTLWAASPSYSAATIFNTCNQAPGPYAPNSVISILGTGMATSAQGLTSADVAGGTLPTTLNGVQVFVSGWPAPLFYVSDTQVNFLMPPNQIAGPVTVWVVRNSNAGPQVSLTLQDAAPALFPSPLAPDYAIAQHWPDYSSIAPSSPAAPGGIVILYATGLGRTDPSPSQPAEIPLYAGWIERMNDLQVYLDGKPLDPAKVLYAGLAPGWPGLYQIDLVLPDDAGPDPEIRVAIGNQASPPGLKLAVQ